MLTPAEWPESGQRGGGVKNEGDGGGRHVASCIRHILVVLFSRTQNSANIFYFPPLKIAPMLRLTQPRLLLLFLLLPLVAVVALVVGRMWVAIFVVSLCRRCRRRRCLCLCWKARRIIGGFTRSPSQRLVRLTHRERELKKEKEERERKMRRLLCACVARWLRKWIRVLFFGILHSIFLPWCISCFVSHFTLFFPLLFYPYPSDGGTPLYPSTCPSALSVCLSDSFHSSPVHASPRDFIVLQNSFIKLPLT